MRKIAIFALLFTFAIFAICFAANKPVQAAKSAKDDMQTVIGKVAAVTIADPAKGIAQGSLTILDEAGKATTFTVKGTVKVLDEALNAITLNKLKPGSKVEIKHKNSDVKQISAKK